VLDARCCRNSSRAASSCARSRARCCSSCSWSFAAFRLPIGQPLRRALHGPFIRKAGILVPIGSPFLSSVTHRTGSRSNIPRIGTQCDLDPILVMKSFPCSPPKSRRSTPRVSSRRCAPSQPDRRFRIYRAYGRSVKRIFRRPRSCAGGHRRIWCDDIRSGAHGGAIWCAPIVRESTRTDSALFEPNSQRQPSKGGSQ